MICGSYDCTVPLNFDKLQFHGRVLHVIHHTITIPYMFYWEKVEDRTGIRWIARRQFYRHFWKKLKIVQLAFNHNHKYSRVSFTSISRVIVKRTQSPTNKPLRREKTARVNLQPNRRWKPGLLIIDFYSEQLVSFSQSNTYQRSFRHGLLHD